MAATDNTEKFDVLVNVHGGGFTGPVSYTHLDVYKRQLLKIVEGTVASVPPQGGRKHPQQEFIQIDTCLLYTSRWQDADGHLGRQILGRQ